jgi:beta-phosphoglucomutase family hydrolase
MIESSRWEGLIFDCDGTLADTMPLHYLAWRSTMSGYGIDFSEQQFYGLAGTPTLKIVELLLSEQGIEADPRQIALEKEQSFLERLDQVQPIEPVVELARRFRATHPMGVGSGSNYSVVLRILEQIGLGDFFDAIVAAEDTSRHKPEPDVFLEVARRIGVDPARCCVFEDADLGIEAAQRGGMGWFDIRQVFRPRRISV